MKIYKKNCQTSKETNKSKSKTKKKKKAKPKKPKRRSTIWPTYIISWIMSPKLDIPFHQNLVIFTVALFAIAGKWKRHKCPSSNEWITKMWYTPIMKFYSDGKNLFSWFFLFLNFISFCLDLNYCFLTTNLEFDLVLFSQGPKVYYWVVYLRTQTGIWRNILLFYDCFHCVLLEMECYIFFI